MAIVLVRCFATGKRDRADRLIGEIVTCCDRARERKHLTEYRLRILVVQRIKHDHSLLIILLTSYDAIVNDLCLSHQSD